MIKDILPEHTSAHRYHHPQNRMNFPNKAYSMEIRQFSITVGYVGLLIKKNIKKSNIGILAYADISILKN